MKADHRHELKTNELADWLTHFPEWAQENRTTLIGAGVVIVLLIAVYFVRFYRADAGLRQHVQLTNLVTQVPAQRRQISQAATQGADQSLVLLPVAQDLENFADNTGDDRMAAMALIKRAEALRAELHYRQTEPSHEEVVKQIGQAQESYQQALDRAASVPALAAIAEFGLGLCEEELGNLDQAKMMYRAIAENADYEGTAGQVAAARRVGTVDDYKGTVVFKPAPQPKPEAPAAAPGELGTTGQLGTSGAAGQAGATPAPSVSAANDVYIAPTTPSETPPSNATSESNAVETNEPAGN